MGRRFTHGDETPSLRRQALAASVNECPWPCGPPMTMKTLRQRTTSSRTASVNECPWASRSWGRPPGLQLTSWSAPLGPPIKMKNQSTHPRGINQLQGFSRDRPWTIGPPVMKEKGGTFRASHRTAAERIQQACPLFFAALQTRFPRKRYAMPTCSDFQRWSSGSALARCRKTLPLVLQQAVQREHSHARRKGQDAHLFCQSTI